MTIEKRISKARTILLLDYPWFGSLAMNLRMKSCDNIQTFDVDGTTMRYNPEFAASLTDAEITAVIAHEVMHCALLHIYRRNGRDSRLWNEAADYAINLELTKEGLKLPKGCLLDYKYAGLSAEVIYSQLQRNQQQQPKQGKQSQDGQPTGTFSDAPQEQKGSNGQQQPTDAPEGQQSPVNGMTEQDWKIAAEQASKVAKKAGKLSGDMERTIQKARESVTDWRQELREFLEQTTPSDYSWQNPNRRFIQAGLYLPSVIKEGMGRLVIGCDTSGSISQDDLNAFAAEVSAIASELKPETIDVIYCDSTVKSVQKFTDEDIKLKPMGGGGTMFKPVFDYVAKNFDEPPKAMLYFSSDLENCDAPEEPTDYPVLWVTSLATTKQHPFGRVIKID